MSTPRTWRPRSGDEMTIPHSELAMATHMAGKAIVSYQLVEDGAYVYVTASDGTRTEGTPGEVLPFGLAHRHRIGAYAGHQPNLLCGHCQANPRRVRPKAN